MATTLTGTRSHWSGAAAVVVAIVAACGGTSSTFFGRSGDAGPGGGSAICGANGTNACPAGQQCDFTLGCVACTLDSQCPVAAPFCVDGACATCLNRVNCEETMPSCWPSTHTCHASCTTTMACPGADRPLCDMASGACVECVTAADCNGNAKICDSVRQQCVECAADGDCPQSRPRCLRSARACVECLANADCGVAAPVCDPQTFSCRQGCTSDAACPVATPRCDLAIAQCVQCTTNLDCPAATPICNLAAFLGMTRGLCMQCATDTDCPQTTPRCVVGTCTP